MRPVRHARRRVEALLHRSAAPSGRRPRPRRCRARRRRPTRRCCATCGTPHGGKRFCQTCGTPGGDRRRDRARLPVPAPPLPPYAAAPGLPTRGRRWRPPAAVAGRAGGGRAAARAGRGAADGRRRRRRLPAGARLGRRRQRRRPGGDPTADVSAAPTARVGPARTLEPPRPPPAPSRPRPGRRRPSRASPPTTDAVPAARAGARRVLARPGPAERRPVPGAGRLRRAGVGVRRRRRRPLRSVCATRPGSSTSAATTWVT